MILQYADSTQFLLHILSCKDELLVRINEEAIVKSMYMESSLYEAIGQQYMIAFDIAQAKGCPEAMVESYYSCMDSQKMKGVSPQIFCQPGQRLRGGCLMPCKIKEQ